VNFFYLGLDLRMLIVPSSSTCTRNLGRNTYLDIKHKAQGAKVATRHESNTHEGSNKHKSSNKCKNSSKAQSTKAATPAKATTQAKVATRCKGAKVATRCKSVKATLVKTTARCEAQRH
jgi:hypothetical protein